MITTHQHSRYLTLGMMLAATNMRLPITMMPGLISSLKHTLGLPSSMAGLLTTIPLLTFAVMSPLIAHWGRRFGNELTIYVMLVFLAVGSYLRVIPTIAALFIGTLLVGIGADGGNVLIPAIIKDNFPTKIPVATSQYTLSMLLVGSLGTGLSGVLAAHRPLSVTMAVLSAIGLLNLIVWLPNLKYNHRASMTAETADHATMGPEHGSVWRWSSSHRKRRMGLKPLICLEWLNQRDIYWQPVDRCSLVGSAVNWAGRRYSGWPSCSRHY